MPPDGLREVPPVFVSVASKGFSQSVSLLSATLRGMFISVAAKGLKAMLGSAGDAPFGAPGEPFGVAQGEPKWEEYPLFVRDKSGQRIGIAVRPERTFAIVRDS
jgi:hypothetical protein